MLIKSILMIVALALSYGNLYAMDLTGKWACNDGGTYYLRQIGQDLYWYGERNEANPAWSNVFIGRVEVDTVKGKWSDVPKGQNMGSGSLLLKIGNNGNSLISKEKTGGFGGSNWTKQVQLMPQRSCSVSGHITGEMQFVKSVALYGPNDKRIPYATIPVDERGAYRFSGVPSGTYKIMPLPGGKFGLKSTPRERVIECTEGEETSIDFNISGIEEG